MQQDKCVISSTSYFDCQYELTVNLLELGEAIQKNSESDVVLEYFERLQIAVTRLVSTKRFQLLKKWFKLEELDLQILVIIYINQLEPETVAPYLQLSWFDHGPALTLERLILLTRQGGDLKNSNVSYLLSESNLFKWGVIRSQEDSFSLIQSFDVAGDIYNYLLSGNSPSFVGGSCFLAIDVIHSPAIAICYSSVMNMNVRKANVISGLTLKERIAFVRELSVKSKKNYYQVLSEDNELLNNPALLSSLRSLLLKERGRVFYLYWPDLMKYFINNNEYGELLLQLLALPNLRLFFDDMKELESTNFLAKELFQQHMPGQSRWGKVRLSPPSNREKSSVWLAISEEIVAEVGRSIDPINATDAEMLTNLYPLYPSTMADIGRRVKDDLVDNESNSLFSAIQEACLIANSKSMGQLANLSKPRFKLNHMVLSASTKGQLNELIDRIRFGDELRHIMPNFLPGVKALFWGKPGTGKSMAAEAIAGQLKLPLYKVNLANVASKWIGESEKNLSKLFDDAQKQNAVLLFDEADAIFSKRSEIESSHDKNANMGVSYLLQRMETYTGLLLLSTNLKGNLDDAFLRRFNNTIEFPLPDVNAREVLWSNVWSGRIQPSRNLDTDTLAKLFEFSPSQINNIVERAILYALTNDKEEVTKELLAKAIRRELEKQSSNYLAEKKLTDWLAL